VRLSREWVSTLTMTGVDEALRQRPRGIRPALPGLLGDERLARMAADGDERAFAAIYRRHGQELHRYCTAILGNTEDAADALQNTMVSALRTPRARVAGRLRTLSPRSSS
jgi:Sigma-70 region 2